MATQSTNTVDLEDGRRVVRTVFRRESDDVGAPQPSTTWTKPTPDNGWEIEYHRVALINGGGVSGTSACVNAPVGSPGGLHGGWQERYFADSELPTSVNLTIGASGFVESGADDGSSTTKFGNIFQGKNGTNLVVYRDGTTAASPNAPGSGGNGGGSFLSGSNNRVASTNGFRGDSSGSTTGGASTNFLVDGNPGQNGPSDPIVFAGGSGGGGGCGQTTAGSVGKAGGNGGNPGGGAGGFGAIPATSGSISWNPTPFPGAGGACVWTYMTRLPTTAA